MTLSRSVRPGFPSQWIASLRVPQGSLRDLPALAIWDKPLRRIVPIVFAISTGFQVTKYIVVPEGIGFDARLYVQATRAWLAGGDPWSVSSLGIPYGAPPPTLLAFAPFTPLADWLVAIIWVVGSFVLAYLAIRALGLPLWWIGFWPIVDGALVGNPDVAVLALLVIARQYVGGLAPVLKIYALLPLVAERRWKSLTAFGIAILVTFSILPWGLWIAELPSISLALERTAATTSVSGNLPLMAIGSVALVTLGWRRAGWLAVPVLWPWTQPHYLAMSLPALTPMLAIAWSIPNPPPLVVLGSVVLAAIGFRLAPPKPEGRTRHERADRSVVLAPERTTVANLQSRRIGTHTQVGYR